MAVSAVQLAERVHEPVKHRSQPEADSDRDGMLAVGPADLRGIGFALDQVGPSADQPETEGPDHRAVGRTVLHDSPRVDDIVASQAQVNEGRQLRRQTFTNELD